MQELHRTVKSGGQIGIVDFANGKESHWMGNINLESLLSPHGKNIISKTLHYDWKVSYPKHKHKNNPAFQTYIIKVQ